MESTRQQKINKLIQRDLGENFRLESRSILTTGAMITVTKVSVTKDLAIAKVYLSLFPVDDKETLIKKIKSNSKLFRKMLASKVRHQLRVVPELNFVLDDSLDYSENIDKLLKDG